MISVRRLTKNYGAVCAVNDLSFDVEPGTVTGFLGPNGAGKSTTMRMVLGLDLPTSGAALVNGRDHARMGAPGRPTVRRRTQQRPTAQLHRIQRMGQGPRRGTHPAAGCLPLAARSCDLRHAAVSTWLNAGVPATQVAEWAGHSVEVLLSIYAKCVDGDAARYRAMIDAALGTPGSARDFGAYSARTPVDCRPQPGMAGHNKIAPHPRFRR